MLDTRYDPRLPPWLQVKARHGGLRNHLAVWLVALAAELSTGAVGLLVMRVAWLQGWRPGPGSPLGEHVP